MLFVISCLIMRRTVHIGMFDLINKHGVILLY
jgi:hypothetical protein